MISFPQEGGPEQAAPNEVAAVADGTIGPGRGVAQRLAAEDSGDSCGAEESRCCRFWWWFFFFLLERGRRE